MSRDPQDCAEKLALRVRAAIAEFQEQTGNRYEPEILAHYVEGTTMGGRHRTFFCTNVSVIISSVTSSDQL